MDYDLEEFKQQVTTFSQTKLSPIAAQIDIDNDFPTPMWRELGDAGLLGITIPESFGGRGLDYLAHLVAMEEISRASGSVGLSYAAHANICLDNLYRFGTEAQRQRYVPKLCSGEFVGGLAMSEREAGSDVVGSMGCRAERKGDVWVANGGKKWTTNGPDADVLIVYMRTAPKEAGSHCMTAFLIDKDMPGFKVLGKEDKLGMRGSNTGILSFESCEIPEHHVLGEVNEGVALLMQGLDSERLVLAGGPIGIMQAALDVCLPWAQQRKQFGKAIGSFELIQAKLADIYMQIEAARAFAYRVGAAFDGSRGFRKQAAAAYLFASDAVMEVASEAMQILGGPGYMNESVTTRLLRDAKVYHIGGGTSEIRRMLIGREMFGGH